MTIKTELELLKKDVSDMKHIHSRLDTAITKLTDVSNCINKILAGVKKFGTLAEFSLGSLLDDLLPASRYLSLIHI